MKVGKLGAKFTPFELITQQYAGEVKKQVTHRIMASCDMKECKSYFGHGSKWQQAFALM
jgi:hypothetical protein